MLIDVLLCLACIRGSYSRIWIIGDQAIAFREDNQFLSRYIILLNCLTNEYFRNPLISINA